MGNVIMATTHADAAAIEAIEQHHAELAGAMGIRVDAVLAAARAAGTDHEWKASRDDLATWCETELVPHALAEEDTLYPAAHALPEGRLLATAMSAEHVVLTDLVRRLGQATDAVDAAAIASGLRTLFTSHVDKENEVLLPLLAGASGVELHALLEGMHAALAPAAADDHAEQEGHGGCGCGGTDSDELPVLDARTVPHAIRHATIFGALGGVAPGGGMVLVAPHDPLPLLAQIEERHPGVFAVDYLQRGPEDWHLRFVRRA